MISRQYHKVFYASLAICSLIHDQKYLITIQLR